jgi:DNA-binding NtrC family response regulator
LLPAQPIDSSADTRHPKKNTKLVSWRILVLDDEKIICKILKRTLESAGHEVITVNDGVDAVMEWSERPFDLGIFDLTIPGGTGGEEAINQIHKFDPKARAIASSGYATDAIMANYTEYGFIKRLAKPYRIDDVLKIINELQENDDADESEL